VRSRPSGGSTTAVRSGPGCTGSSRTALSTCCAPNGGSDALDLPVGTVNSRLARALEQLRETLEVEHVD
jgi:hypothetical protein